MPRVQLTSDEVGRGRVVVGGADLSDVVGGAAVHTAVGSVTDVTLDLTAVSVQLDADVAQVEVTPDVRDALVALGWTPPGAHALDRGPVRNADGLVVVHQLSDRELCDCLALHTYSDERRAGCWCGWTAYASHRHQVTSDLEAHLAGHGEGYAYQTRPWCR